MGMSREEHDRALEEAVVELAQATGLQVADHPALAAIARLMTERRAADEYRRREGERQFEQDLLDRANRKAAFDAQKALDDARYGPPDANGFRRGHPLYRGK
jgi:hypothetical protein